MNLLRNNGSSFVDGEDVQGLRVRCAASVRRGREALLHIYEALVHIYAGGSATFVEHKKGAY